MASQSLRFGLAAVIFLLAVVILLVSFWPEVRSQQVVPLPPVVLPTPTTVGAATPVGAVTPVGSATTVAAHAFGGFLGKGL